MSCGWNELSNFFRLHRLYDLFFIYVFTGYMTLPIMPWALCPLLSSRSFSNNIQQPAFKGRIKRHCLLVWGQKDILKIIFSICSHKPSENVKPKDKLKGHTLMAVCFFLAIFKLTDRIPLYYIATTLVHMSELFAFNLSFMFLWLSSSSRLYSCLVFVDQRFSC